MAKSVHLLDEILGHPNTYRNNSTPPIWIRYLNENVILTPRTTPAAYQTTGDVRRVLATSILLSGCGLVPYVSLDSPRWREVVVFA